MTFDPCCHRSITLPYFGVGPTGPWRWWTVARVLKGSARSLRVMAPPPYYMLITQNGVLRHHLWCLSTPPQCGIPTFTVGTCSHDVKIKSPSQKVNRPANRVRKKNQVSFVAVVKWKYYLNHEWHINSSYWYHFKIQQSGSLHMCVCMIFTINNNDIAFINCNRIV